MEQCGAPQRAQHKTGRKMQLITKRSPRKCCYQPVTGQFGPAVRDLSPLLSQLPNKNDRQQRQQEEQQQQQQAEVCPQDGVQQHAVEQKADEKQLEAVRHAINEQTKDLVLKKESLAQSEEKVSIMLLGLGSLTDSPQSRLKQD